jgi:hypothetical protein
LQVDRRLSSAGCSTDLLLGDHLHRAGIDLDFTSRRRCGGRIGLGS